MSKTYASVVGTVRPMTQTAKPIGKRFVVNKYTDLIENERIEFKAQFNIRRRDDYRKTINAFLNTEGGHLIFGIADDGLICGMHMSPEKSNHRNPLSRTTQRQAFDAFKLWVDDLQFQQFSPRIVSLKVEEQQLSKKRFLWIVNVPKANQPIYFQRCLYKRLNASTVCCPNWDVNSSEEEKEKEEEKDEEKESSSSSSSSENEVQVDRKESTVVHLQQLQERTCASRVDELHNQTEHVRKLQERMSALREYVKKKKEKEKEEMDKKFTYFPLQLCFQHLMKWFS